MFRKIGSILRMLPSQKGRMAVTRLFAEASSTAQPEPESLDFIPPISHLESSFPMYDSEALQVPPEPETPFALPSIDITAPKTRYHPVGLRRSLTRHFPLLHL